MFEMSDGELQVWNGTYSAGWLARIRKIDVAKTEAESIRLYQQLRDRYGSMKAVQDIDYGTLATSAIFAIEHLSVGKPAPDIIGEDMDGAGLKLSDYRGKVVLLSFWGEWCAPCMALIPHEKELLARLDGKPFALIGVNSDADKKKVKALQIPWRSFWCGEKGPLGDIPMAWSIRGWPKMYVLDQAGVIRAKHTTDERIDEIIDHLLLDLARVQQD